MSKRIYGCVKKSVNGFRGDCTATSVDVSRVGRNLQILFRGSGELLEVQVRLPDELAASIAGMMLAVASGCIPTLKSEL